MSRSVTEWECLELFFGLPEVRNLRPGVLDHDAEHVFTSGHCHSFAEAIRRLAPTAELVFAFDVHGEEDDEGEVQGHVLVRFGGRYLDVRGWVYGRLEASDANRAFEREWDQVIAIDRLGWLDYSSGWFVPRISEAAPFAETLLRRLQIPIRAAPACRGRGDQPNAMTCISAEGQRRPSPAFRRQLRCIPGAPEALRRPSGPTSRRKSLTETETAPAGAPAMSLPGMPAAPSRARAHGKIRRAERAREAAAAQRELVARFGSASPTSEAPLGFRFTLQGAEASALGAGQLLGRCILVRPYVREVFELGVTAREGSWRSERSFQVPGTDPRAVQAVFDLIPPEITYTAGAWAAQNRRASTRHEKLNKELGKLGRSAPRIKVREHSEGEADPLAQVAILLRANSSQGLFGRILTRPVGWLSEESPVNAWPVATPRPPEALLAHEALELAQRMSDAEIELDDPEGILEPLEALARQHLVARRVPGLPGLAEVLHGQASGWPLAVSREVTAEEARREVARAREAGVRVVLDPEVADVLRMAAARPALDGDLLPPQRDAVARHRATEVGMLNFSKVGTGKTAMTLIAARGKAAELEAYRMCVALPRYMRSEWVDELIPKFWPGIAMHIAEDRRIAAGLIGFDSELGPEPGILIATFEQVRTAVEDLRVLTYDDLVVEEADEALANPGTQLARALWRLRERAKVAVLMTGTPRGKSNDEYDALEAFARNDREALRAKPLSRRYATFDEVSQRRVRRAMGPTMVRLTREDMKDYMPELDEPEFKIIDPTLAELALLDAAEERIASLFGTLREQVERAAALAPDDPELAVLRKRMASTRGLLLSATEVALLAASDAEALRASKAVAAALLESEGLIDAVVRTGPSKRAWIAGTAAAAAADGEKTLLFAESVELLRLLSRELAEAHGVEAPLFIGGIGEREAARLKRSFRLGEFPVMLMSPIGRRGHNLPASLVGHYDLPWTPRPFEQRIGRATRTGSEYDTVGVLLALLNYPCELHRAGILIPRAAEVDGVLNRGEDASAAPGEGGSEEFARQFAGLATELADREGASAKMKVAAQIFAARREAVPLAA
jgi:superfamily II DNA or RNA helicase